MAARTCKFIKGDGEPCRSPPLHDSEFCWMHSPEHAEEVAEARRLGGLRRRREKITSGAYAFEGLEGVTQIGNYPLDVGTDLWYSIYGR